MVLILINISECKLTMRKFRIVSYPEDGHDVTPNIITQLEKAHTRQVS